MSICGSISNAKSRKEKKRKREKGKCLIVRRQNVNRHPPYGVYPYGSHQTIHLQHPRIPNPESLGKNPRRPSFAPHTSFSLYLFILIFSLSLSLFLPVTLCTSVLYSATLWTCRIGSVSYQYRIWRYNVYTTSSKSFSPSPPPGGKSEIVGWVRVCKTIGVTWSPVFVKSETRFWYGWQNITFVNNLKRSRSDMLY